MILWAVQRSRHDSATAATANRATAMLNNSDLARQLRTGALKNSFLSNWFGIVASWQPGCIVTVHSVPSNALRDAQKRQKTSFRAADLGFSVTSATLHSQKTPRGLLPVNSNDVSPAAGIKKLPP